MRVGICEWTTFPYSFEDELDACWAMGGGAIGILEFKTAPSAHVRARLRDRGLAASNCMPMHGSILPSPLIPGPEEPEARVESICESIARFAPLEPACVFFLTGPGEDRATVVEGIERIAEAGRRHGVRVALEPIHPSQADTLSSVHTIEEALDLIGGADVGILFDTWHLQDVSHVERIYGVHVADHREPERSDMDRAFPGDGSRAAVRALESAGFDGWYDVEVMSDDGTFGNAFEDSLWALPVVEIAGSALAAMEAL